MVNYRFINNEIARDIAYIGPTENITSSNNEITTEEEITLNNERTYDAFKMLGTKEVAEILKCNHSTAREVMSRADFPLIMVGKNYRVSEKSFAEWVQGRHTCDNFYGRRN